MSKLFKWVFFKDIVSSVLPSHFDLLFLSGVTEFVSRIKVLKGQKIISANNRAKKSANCSKQNIRLVFAVLIF